MRVLGVETATGQGGVAVVGPEGLLAEVTLSVTAGYAERLLPALRRLPAVGAHRDPPLLRAPGLPDPGRQEGGGVLCPLRARGGGAGSPDGGYCLLSRCPAPQDHPSHGLHRRRPGILRGGAPPPAERESPLP